MIYAFVESPAKIEDLKDSNAYQMHELLKKKSFKELSKEEKEKLKGLFNELWHSETYQNGIVRLLGYIIDFKEYLKTFWVKNRYYGIREIKAFNKTFVRSCSNSPSQIIKIVEVK